MQSFWGSVFLLARSLTGFTLTTILHKGGGKASDWVCLAGAENSTIENTTLFKQILPVKILVN